VFLDGVIENKKSDIIGRTAEELFHPDEAKTYIQQDELVVHSGKALRDEIEVNARLDGSLGWFLTNEFPIFNDSGEVIGIALISQDLGTTRDSAIELGEFRTIIEHIQNHLSEPLKTEELASQIGWSAKQLDRRMKRVFRLSTSKYITKSRIDAGIELLVTTEKSISDIALSCGFSEQSAFTRQFAAAVGRTPAAFRKSHQKGGGV